MLGSLVEVHSVSDEVCFFLFVWLTYSSALKMEAVHSSDMLLNFYWIIWLQIPEVIISHSHSHENLSSSVVKNSSLLLVLSLHMSNRIVFMIILLKSFSRF
jgi:hypothetical protein